VKGNSVTAIIDCNIQQNRPLPRDPGDTITNTGIILVGQQIDENSFLDVSLKKPCFIFKLCITSSLNYKNSFLIYFIGVG